MKIIRNLSRYIVGIIFIISGFVKIVDPTGTAIKFEEYFVVFATNFHPIFSELIPYAMFFSVFLTSLEIVLGIALLILYQMKTTSWAYLGMILLFTFLTLYSAVTGEVTDCGCFGDAVKLEPWETFWKDIALTILILIIFFQRKKFHSVSNNVRGTLVIAISTLACVFFAKYNLDHLPMIDFRQYAIGNNIRTLRSDGEAGVYSYIMEKDGEKKEFDVWPTEKGWKYVDMVTVESPKMPTINDFMLNDEEGEDVTESVLNGNKLLVITQNVAYFDLQYAKQINDLAGTSTKTKTVVITGSGFETYAEFNKEAQLNFPVYTIDEVVIKAMIRSNPGLILLQDGVVKGKWHYNDIPTAEEIEELL